MMLSITRLHRCYLYRGFTDMRKGIDSLCGLIRNELGKDPMSGELFIFFCRARRRIKILLWEKLAEFLSSLILEQNLLTNSMMTKNRQQMFKQQLETE